MKPSRVASSSMAAPAERGAVSGGRPARHRGRSRGRRRHLPFRRRGEARGGRAEPSRAGRMLRSLWSFLKRHKKKCLVLGTFLGGERPGRGSSRAGGRKEKTPSGPAAGWLRAPRSPPGRHGVIGSRDRVWTGASGPSLCRVSVW